MKTAFVSLSASRAGGGIFECMRRLGQELVRGEAVEVEMLGLADAESAADAGAWPPVRVRTFPARKLAGFRISPGLRRALRETGADLAHTHGLWSDASVAASAWKRATGGPTVVSPHGMLDPWALRHSGWKKRIAAGLFEGRHLRGAGCLHALCAAEADAVRAYGLRNPVCIIPNGVDLPAPPPDPDPGAPWRESVRPERKILLYLGRIHPKKGLDSLLRAWAALQKETPAAVREWTLVIAGWDQGGHASELQRLAGEWSLGTAVHFAGPLFGEAKAAAYRHAHAFVLPSLSEGLPLVVLEAWSHRLPVVMTAACNLPEGFAAGAALESDPSAEGLAGTLAELMNAKTDLARMGANGRALVESRFTWSGVAAQMAEVYRWVLGEADKPACVLT